MQKEAYTQAIAVLKKCATSHGFHAAYPGYDAVWARDSVIASLGASLLGTQFKETFKQSLITLVTHQSEHGQIPNAVDKWSTRKPHVDYKTVDSTLWFVIGEHSYKERYQDNSLFKQHHATIQKALTWLGCQEIGENGLLGQLPTTDWQDAFPHRYGYTINTQALYYKVLCLIGEKKKSQRVKKIVNNDKDDGLWNGTFYLPWRWKNHGKYREMGNWFDALGNLLAIIFDLADKKQAEKIISYIKQKNIDKPYPVKAIFPPIQKGSADWQDYFEDCEARLPYHYLNAGIWTVIGSFYVLALLKQKKFQEAVHQLEKLAEANMQKPYFSEWLHGKTGKPGQSASGSLEGNQAWNAGMYIAAFESVRRQGCLI